MDAIIRSSSKATESRNQSLLVFKTRSFIFFISSNQQSSMELSLVQLGQLSSPLPSSLCSPKPIAFVKKRRSLPLSCRCSIESSPDPAAAAPIEGRRRALGFLLTAAASGLSSCGSSDAVSTSRRALRGAKIPESEFTTLPNGLKYYDLKVGGGTEAKKGSRVAVHYVAKWRGVTFMTSRQGLGVTGGTPYGFDVGNSERGFVLKGLDLGVQGMRVGGQRLLIVPPELAYGSKGVQEIPPNATIEFDVELLSVKQSPFGTGVKIIEG